MTCPLCSSEHLVRVLVARVSLILC
uniref:Uncharacterized protein n=1 Tax=Arundo donax TaxID=35708 RepID=A0A0A9B8A1_ARUDO